MDRNFNVRHGWRSFPIEDWVSAAPYTTPNKKLAAILSTLALLIPPLTHRCFVFEGS